MKFILFMNLQGFAETAEAASKLGPEPFGIVRMPDALAGRLKPGATLLGAPLSLCGLSLVASR